MDKTYKKYPIEEKIAEYINILGRFCGKRDIKILNADELKNKYKIDKTDIMVLFGGSIIAGGDVLADAMKKGIAEKYIVVGGMGHTTEYLRKEMHEVYPAVITANLSEAEIFAAYLKEKYNLNPDFLETESTNCGNNISYLLKLLKRQNIKFSNILISQDAAMQYRMETVLKKYMPEISVINFAAYSATAAVRDGELIFIEDISGMWKMKDYITLLMGEIPRLTDNKSGYGPMGKNYIIHVDIPAEVENAFNELKKIYGTLIRRADQRYSSK
ncbi:YdcF family protein [Pectinatus haikarae]|uniref:YdcF family protein n=1 Tax=Pectinatus haikarae TaxID=349096 RepID=UPI0018C4BEC7|nr:YdcF family protein [Pectinatus haikarae]